jgi:hypothetical protein
LEAGRHDEHVDGVLDAVAVDHTRLGDPRHRAGDELDGGTLQRRKQLAGKHRALALNGMVRGERFAQIRPIGEHRLAKPR